MGPYCKFCNQRCFVHFPDETPPEALASYAGSTIIATCLSGQAFELKQVGWCYQTIQEAINKKKEQSMRLTGRLIHEAFRSVEPTAKVWDEVSEARRRRYDEMADSLNDWLHLGETGGVEGPEINCEQAVHDVTYVNPERYFDDLPDPMQEEEDDGC